MLAHSLTVIFTNDAITHKEKINLLSFRALKKKKKRKKRENGPSWPLCKVVARDKFFGINCFLIRNQF